ncbi:MAG TPA: ATP-binding cassette domain-containing protein, partial [Myxococcota bacterium]|nr:ATP-binding cassette domain-containing protein [Myxococcota bacterium]
MEVDRRLLPSPLLIFAALYLFSFLLPGEIAVDVEAISEGPGAVHWLGTDHLGRDVLHRLLLGSRSFFLPGLGAAVGAVSLGTASGALAGFFGGKVAELLRYLHTVLSSVPSFVLALLVVTIFSTRGQPLPVLAAACILSEAPRVGEAVWAFVDTLRRQEFVLALQAHGIGRFRILLYHVLWVNGRFLLLRHFLSVFGTFLVLEVSLSYLELSGTPPNSWGNMIAFELGQSQGNLLAWMAPALLVWLGIFLSVPTAFRRGPAPLPPVVIPATEAPEGAGTCLQLHQISIVCGSGPLVTDASWQVRAGELVALVGPSGSGKSLTVRAALGLLPVGLQRRGGTVRLSHDGQSHLLRSEVDFEKVRGSWIGLVDQDSRASLDPTSEIGAQLSRAAALAGQDENPLPWLQKAGFSQPERVAGLYPHELSGGMAQRAAIAMVLARGSRFILADECTSGLDASVQKQILEELARLRSQGHGVLLVTHDLRILPGLADRIVVLEGGKTVEEAAELAALRLSG